MIIGVIVQQPTDNLDYDIDCASLFNNQSDSVASVTANVSPAGLSVAALVSDTNTVKLWVTGGVANTTYSVEFQVTTTQGRIKEDEFEVIIEEFE
jgi:hypothetical protein